MVAIVLAVLTGHKTLATEPNFRPDNFVGGPLSCGGFPVARMTGPMSNVRMTILLLHADTESSRPRVAYPTYFHCVGRYGCRILYSQLAWATAGMQIGEDTDGTVRHRDPVPEQPSCGNPARLQKSAHRDFPARQCVEPDCETQRGLFAAGDDVTEVCSRAAGGGGDLVDRHAVAAAPA